MPAPFVPKIKNEMDVSNFSDEFTNMAVTDSPAIVPLQSDKIFKVIIYSAKILSFALPSCQKELCGIAVLGFGSKVIVIVIVISASSGEALQRHSRPNKTKPCSKRMVFRQLRKRGRDRARSSERRWLDCSCNQSVWLQEQSCCLLMFTRLTRYG